MRQGASQLVVQRSASQLPGVEWRSASQLSGQLDMEVYPYLLKQRPTSQLSHAEAYPHLVKNGNRLVPLPTTQGSLSQAQLEELYPRLVQHQLSSSVQLSQLPGAQLSADLSQLHLSSAIAPPPDYENVLSDSCLDLFAALLRVRAYPEVRGLWALLARSARRAA